MSAASQLVTQMLEADEPESVKDFLRRRIPTHAMFARELPGFTLLSQGHAIDAVDIWKPYKINPTLWYSVHIERSSTSLAVVQYTYGPDGQAAKLDVSI